MSEETSKAILNRAWQTKSDILDLMGEIRSLNRQVEERKETAFRSSEFINKIGAKLGFTFDLGSDIFAHIDRLRSSALEEAARVCDARYSSTAHYSDAKEPMYCAKAIRDLRSDTQHQCQTKSGCCCDVCGPCEECVEAEADRRCEDCGHYLDKHTEENGCAEGICDCMIGYKEH